MRSVLAGIGVAAAVLVASACSGGGGFTSNGEAGGATAAAATTQAASDEAAVAATTEAASTAASPEGSSAVAAALDLPGGGPRVVQTASLELSVPKGDFAEAVDRARTLVVGLGGYVTSSTASQGPERRLVSGSLVLRVPEEAYGRTMAALTKLGRIESRQEAGQDVTGEFVDLQARKRHLEAVEAQLLGFLKRTRTVAEALAVQSRLDDVQLRLERVRGRLASLDDQSSYATITLLVSERGTPVAKPVDDGGWSIGDAWHAAARGLVKVAGGALVVLVVAGPILLVLAALLYAGRLVVRRRRAHGEPSSTAG